MLNIVKCENKCWIISYVGMMICANCKPEGYYVGVVGSGGIQGCFYREAWTYLSCELENDKCLELDDRENGKDSASDKEWFTTVQEQIDLHGESFYQYARKRHEQALLFDDELYGLERL